MLAAPAAANNGLPCFQQGDCPSADAGSTVSATAAAQSNQMPVVSSDQMLAVESGQLAEAAANANNPVLKQGDCPPADAGSSVRTKNHADGSDDHVPLKSRSCHQPAANSTAADAATAQLKESSMLGSQQGDYSATDALISPVAAKYAQGIAAADLFSTTSRAAATATDRLKESLVCGPKQGDYSATDALSPPVAAEIAQDITAAAQNDSSSLAADATTARSMEDPSTITQQEDCSADINFVSVIGLLFYRFKFSVIGLLFYRFKFLVYDRGKSGLKFGMGSTSLSFIF